MDNQLNDRCEICWRLLKSGEISLCSRCWTEEREQDEPDEPIFYVPEYEIEEDEDE